MAQSLWTEKNAPIAALSPDYESFPDPFALGGYVAATAPDLGLMISTDAVRHGPAELMRSVLTLAAAGIDASNIEAGTVLTPPDDPGADARSLRSAFRTLGDVTGRDVQSSSATCRRVTRSW